jgi:ATP-dependent helicase/nuclease subunit A
MSTPTPRLPFEDPDAGPAPVPAPADAGDRAAAVDPRLNVVLEASAGTGKTRVLVDRYVNLVRAGVEPRNILAITFTRKAAAEMRERILATLRKAAGIGEIDARRWRALSERLHEVSISTIDAFCLALLREFPLEAGLDPAFGMADETEALRLIDEALDRTLRICRAVAREDATVALVFAELGEYRLREGLRRLLDRRLVAGPALDRAVRPTPRELTPPAMALATIGRLAATIGAVDRGLARFLESGPIRHPRYRLFASDLRRLLSSRPSPDDAARDVRLVIDGITEYFFTRAGAIRRRWPLYTAEHGDAAALRWHRAAATAAAERLQEDLAAFRRDLNAVLTRGVWKLFRIARDEYRRVLEEHAVVDFPDALERALALVGGMGEFARSRYLLETRFHHLLVDEFQDTSDAQWRLIWHLVQSWAEGLGTSQDAPLPPSIFVVGDRKQSIYGFRDADAAVLARAATQIASLRPEGSPLRAIRQSFRAVPPLLAFTNDLCLALDKRPDRPDAFTYEERDRFPVPPIAGIGDDALAVIAAPDLGSQAEAVASEIDRLLVEGSVRDRETGVMRRTQPGDVAILFRTREGHQAFEAALERRHIPSYVYKGLGFFDADEIKDVFALLRYLANPWSDLRAAALLRSRFVRLSDDALARLSPRLAASILDGGAGDAALADDDSRTLTLLRSSARRWIELADRLRPADLLDRVLVETAYEWELAGAGTGRAEEPGEVSGFRRQQARENLKKVRSLVRRIQNRGYATLGRVAEYLDRLSAGDESNAAIDAVAAVNLMTIHAAKGLEFPVVFLVNLGRGAGGGRDPIRVAVPAGGNGGDEPAVAVSVGDFRSEADDDASDRDREELKRLLYVAVTRARDRLCLATSLDADGRFSPLRGGLGDVLPDDLRTAVERAAQGGARVEWTGSTAQHAFRVVPLLPEDVPPPVRANAPAAAGAADFGRLDPGPDVRWMRISGERLPPPALAAPVGSAVPRPDADARRIGLLVHRLLEQLAPAAAGALTVDGERFRQAAARLLDGDDEAVRMRLQARAAAAAQALAAHPEARAVLQSGDRWHEVPLLFREADVVWSGAADIIGLTDGRLTVLEWKTGEPADAHRVQLDRYVQALRSLSPDRLVEGALVYAEADRAF